MLRFAVLLALGVPTLASAQELRPITLAEAIATAEAKGPGVASFNARAEAADQARRLEAAGLFPQIGVQAGALRSDDPVAAFGGRLRQGRFTQADFDPTALNNPTALTDWTTAVVLQWSPLDMSRLSAIDAAQANAEAAEASASWTARSAAFLAEARFIQAVGAERLLEASQAAVESAEANLEVVGRRVAEGLLTEADVLRAEAASQAATAGHIDAQRQLDDARGRLALALGWDTDVTPVPTGEVEAGAPTSAADAPLAERADLVASASQWRAAEARVEQARRSRLPQIGGFVSFESHAPQALSGLERSWTAGVHLSVPLFTGFAITASQRAAGSAAEAAREAHEDRLRSAHAETREAQRAEVAARQQAVAAQAASTAANEAMRLVRLRFEEGLATTADLLAAQSNAADLSSGAVRARLGHSLATARLRYLTDHNSHTTGLQGGIDS